MDNVKVLIVDDIYANQFLLSAILEEIGCTVESVTNGKAAIDELQQNKYDIVFMDIEMPIMNGIEATKYIKNSQLKDIPVIALTAHNLEDFSQQMQGVGFDNILEKPYSQDKINEVIAKYCK